jgi:hypothetical protein
MMYRYKSFDLEWMQSGCIVDAEWMHRGCRVDAEL